MSDDAAVAWVAASGSGSAASATSGMICSGGSTRAGREIVCSGTTDAVVGGGGETGAATTDAAGVGNDNTTVSSPSSLPAPRNEESPSSRIISSKRLSWSACDPSRMIDVSANAVDDRAAAGAPKLSGVGRTSEPGVRLFCELERKRVIVGVCQTDV